MDNIKKVYKDIICIYDEDNYVDNAINAIKLYHNHLLDKYVVSHRTYYSLDKIEYGEELDINKEYEFIFEE